MAAKQTMYTFKNKKFGGERTTTLTLVWEADYSSYPYDEGMKGSEAWNVWREKMADDTVPIFWFVEGDGVFEGAPFIRDDGQNFLDFFTWPEDPNGERVNWAALPVRDGKSDWIVKYTGWRPAPFTREIPAALIEQAMGLQGA